MTNLVIYQPTNGGVMEEGALQFKNEIVFKIIRKIKAEKLCAAQVDRFLFSLRHTKFVYVFMDKTTDRQLADVFLEYCAKTGQNTPIILFRRHIIKEILRVLVKNLRQVEIGDLAETLKEISLPNIRSEVSLAADYFIIFQINHLSQEIERELLFSIALADKSRYN